MLRILEVKRVFGLIQLILVVVNIIFFISFMLFIYSYDPNSSFSGSGGTESSSSTTNENISDLPKLDVELVSQQLINHKLFGSAGSYDEEEIAKPKEESPPPVSEDVVEETQLNLKLIGTVALSPKDKFSSACIENQDKRITAFFAVGQEVMENVVLEEVYPKEVILLNKRLNPPRKERLKIEDKAESLVSKPVNFPSDRVRVGRVEEDSSQNNVREVEVNRDEIEKEFVASYADLVTRIRPEMYRDESGKIRGVTAKNIEEIPLAKKLGFKNGDVLVAVNDENIDSEDKIIDIIRKHSDPTLPAIKITILRDGKQMDVIYKIR
ncbi:MAG: hypothetical protein N3G21_01420 [Candidatus Hydrogenedentes bacterium]|nr:hypothetical protein [Candidatus Hydrogenedentota bacterium]